MIALSSGGLAELFDEEEGARRKLRSQQAHDRAVRRWEREGKHVYDGLCCVCGAYFTTTRIRQATCGSEECREENRLARCRKYQKRYHAKQIRSLESGRG